MRLSKIPKPAPTVPIEAVLNLPHYDMRPDPPPTDWTPLDESDYQLTLKELRTNKDAAMKFAMALVTFRDKLLYRKTHKTFEAFCLEEIGSDPSYVHRLCGWAEVVKNLLPEKAGAENGQLATPAVLPLTESQARPLRRLPAERQPEAWHHAVDRAGGKVPTAKIVNEEVRKLEGPEPEPEPDENADLKFSTLDQEDPPSQPAAVQPRKVKLDPDLENKVIEAVTCFVKGEGKKITCSYLEGRHDWSREEALKVLDALIDNDFLHNGVPVDAAEEWVKSFDQVAIPAPAQAKVKPARTLTIYLSEGKMREFYESSAGVLQELADAAFGEPCKIKSKSSWMHEDCNLYVCAGSLHQHHKVQQITGHCLIHPLNYEGPEEKQPYSFEGYTVVQDKNTYRLGPQVTFKLDPDSASSSEQEPEPAKPATPEIEQLAKKIFEIGMRAAFPTDPKRRSWKGSTAEIHQAFTAIAHWHCNVTKGLISVPGQVDTDPEPEKRKPQRAQRSQKADIGTAFLILRPASKGAWPHKPRYWSGPNAWTIDPRNAKSLSKEAATERVKKNAKYASCKRDKVVVRNVAVKLFEKRS